MLKIRPCLPVATFCILALGCPFGLVAQNATPSNPADASSEHPIEATPRRELPDSPGAVWEKSENPTAQGLASQASSPQPKDQTLGSNAANKNEDQKDEKLQRPVGTAAAETPKVSGVTAAQPAGAAIAPAKQRRVRTVVLKVGAILGAGAAIGTVVALSASTPSKPPGAH
ncbi:MAG TPA: hypothetical protein VMG82_16370 [Candidatus Sulfotelmatobacter sp.]|nr:hypothetical protein [Candidatus Sulfotelmatobacter sp.]